MRNYTLMAQQITRIHLIPVLFLVFTHNNSDVILALLGLPISSFSFRLTWKNLMVSLIFFLLMNLQYLRFARIVSDLW